MRAWADLIKLALIASEILVKVIFADLQDTILMLFSAKWFVCKEEQDCPSPYLNSIPAPPSLYRLRSQQSIKVIIATMRDYGGDIDRCVYPTFVAGGVGGVGGFHLHLTSKSNKLPRFVGPIMRNCCRELMVQYVKALMSKRFTPKSEEDIEQFASRAEVCREARVISSPRPLPVVYPPPPLPHFTQEETEAIRDVFKDFNIQLTEDVGCRQPTTFPRQTILLNPPPLHLPISSKYVLNQDRDPCFVMEYIVGLLRESKSMIALFWKKLRYDYPDVTLHHLEAILNNRPDMTGREIKQYIKNEIIHEGDEDDDERAARARCEDFFRLIPVSTSTNFKTD